MRNKQDAMMEADQDLDACNLSLPTQTRSTTWSVSTTLHIDCFLLLRERNFFLLTRPCTMVFAKEDITKSRSSQSLASTSAVNCLPVLINTLLFLGMPILQRQHPVVANW